MTAAKKTAQPDTEPGVEGGNGGRRILRIQRLVRGKVGGGGGRSRLGVSTRVRKPQAKEVSHHGLVRLNFYIHFCTLSFILFNVWMINPKGRSRRLLNHPKYGSVVFPCDTSSPPSANDLKLPMEAPVFRRGPAHVRNSVLRALKDFDFISNHYFKSELLRNC